MSNIYEELIRKAISPYATQAYVNALGFWHKENNSKLQIIDGKTCYFVDSGLYLKPVIFNEKTVGYEFIGENAPKRKIKYAHWESSDDGFFDYFVCSHCGRKTKENHLSCCPSCDSIMIK